MIKRYSILIAFLLILVPEKNFAQDVTTLITEAKQLEVAYKDNEAVLKYLEVLKIEPSNYLALCKVSELYSLLGKRQPSKEKQKNYYRAAQLYAKKALNINASNTESNFVMALAMGRMAIISSGEEKINAVKGIRSFAEKCIQLDPQYYKAYHILGRWHYEVSNLSTVEKWLVKISYGSLPPASLKDAITNYEKSKQLNPGLLINYMELAKCYHRKGEDAKAIEMLNSLLKLPSLSLDDPTVKQEATLFLKKLSD